MSSMEVHGSKDGSEAILSDAALAFVAELQRAFGPAIADLLGRRTRDATQLDFLPDTRHIREGKWTCAPMPAELADRRVEITGPVDRKMIINALNSGARVFMADFEDSTTPTWANVVDGQKNLFDAVRRTIAFSSASKSYRLNDETAVLFVRPRGLHLLEKHMLVDGAPVRGALFDFGLFMFHNARELVARGSAPYFYIPKLESHLEARLWNVVFLHAQRVLGIPAGTIKATVLIETLPAAFEMNEILYELREHSAGLNCGRWDYIFSFIKKRANDPTAVLPDRGVVTMDKAFLRAYSQLLIQTCHRRGVHAMGGMAAQIPIKGDAAANAAAFAKVRADKLREVKDGHDGTWVAHPGLVPVAMEIFDAHMPTPNQISAARSSVHVTREDLLAIPPGTPTLEGLRHNVRVGVQYLESWLEGQGCVPLYHLMEDAATAEISRAQVWQWLHHHVTLAGDGKPLDKERCLVVIAEELAHLEASRASGSRDKLSGARKLFESLVLQDTFEEFLTLPAYDRITSPLAQT